MLDKELGKDIPQERRAAFLQDNCDGTEEMNYPHIFTPEELAELKERLSDASIALSDIEHEKKMAMNAFKEEAKPYEQICATTIKKLKEKSEFIDEESRMVGYYNENGDLVSSRPAYGDELQRNIFQAVRKTGTND